MGLDVISTIILLVFCGGIIFTLLLTFDAGNRHINKMASVFRKIRPRRCVRCKQKTFLLGENEELSFLDPNQRSEQNLGGADWEVEKCDSCDYTHISRKRSVATTFLHCYKCNAIAMEFDVSVHLQPTMFKPGEKHIHYQCRICDFSTIERAVIPSKAMDSFRDRGSYQTPRDPSGRY